MASPNLTPNTAPYLPEVYSAICKVAKQMSKDGIGKTGRNTQQGYSFRGIDSVMNALSAPLAAADLCILPRMISRTQEERITAKGGTLFYVTVQADFDFVSARDGSKHTVTFFGEAMDSADKATNKAMSAAYKYCAMQVFCIPTEGMEDADATTPAPQAKSAPKPALVKPPQPAVGKIDELPEYEYEEAPEEDPSELEQQLSQSLAMTRAFAELQLRYRALGTEKPYFGILGLHGRRDANFTDQNEARTCYREMHGDLVRREARAK